MTGYLHDLDFIARHNQPGHVEHAGRLDQLGDFGNGEQIPWRAATEEELLAVHTPVHLQHLKAKCDAGGGMLDPDTYCGPDSETVARSAVGGLIDLTLGVLDGTYSNGLAVVRPPGHHATAERAMGFCLYNNVAVAAAALRSQGVPKVAIVDFDVHHGNGTQDIFYRDKTVLYISSHQYPHYPGSGPAFEKGSGPGLGFTVNHTLEAGVGDEAFLQAYQEHLLPALADFQPGFVLVSAGFDAHAADPLAGLNVTTEGFSTLAGLLVQAAGEVCGGKIVFSLEGGYEPGALADSLKATARVLENPGI